MGAILNACMHVFFCVCILYECWCAVIRILLYMCMWDIVLSVNSFLVYLHVIFLLHIFTEEHTTNFVV